MESPIVNIFRNTLDGRSVSIRAWISLSFLLIPNVVFRTGLDTCVLNTDNGVGKQFPGQERVWREALPVPATMRMST